MTYKRRVRPRKGANLRSAVTLYATDFAVKATDGVITVSGVEGEVSVYDVSGAKVAEATADGGVTIAVPAHGIYVVKAGGKTVKVAM